MAGKIPGETREERFKRVAEARTKEILDKLRLLGNCGNRRSYSYTEADVNKIFNNINKALRISRSKFIFNEKDTFNNFTL